MASGKALAIPVPGPGRKSLYQEAYADQAFKLCLLGATDEELADFFGVDVRTVYRWKDEHPAFCQATIDGKVKADAEVAHSLYRAATGHEVTLEKVVKKKGDGGTEQYEAVRYKSFIPSDPNAAYKWLCNRRRKNWTDNKTVTIDNPSTAEEARTAARAEVNAIFGGNPEIIIEPIHGQ